MKNERLMLLENSEHIEQTLLEWKQYREETGMEIEFEDYQVLMLNEKEYRDLESKAKKLMKYGAAAFISGGWGAIAMYFWRKFTDKCEEKCKDSDEQHKVCKYKCYANACDKALERLDKIVQKKKKDLDDEEKIKKVEKKMEKKKEKWQKKKDKYLKKAEKAEKKV